MIYPRSIDVPAPPAAPAARDPKLDPAPGDVLAQEVGAILLFRGIRKVGSKVRGFTWWSDNPRRVPAEWTLFGWRRWAAGAKVVETGPAPTPAPAKDL